MTYEDIEDELFELRSDVIEIEKQLELYQDNPKHPQWLAKTRAALKIKRLQIADLERRRVLLQGFESIDKAFVQSARTLLDPELFQRVLNDAKERMTA
jgi:hypothetical protein